MKLIQTNIKPPKTRHFYQVTLWVLLLFISVNLVQAQPINDDCEQAVSIADPTAYCSGRTEFTTVAATDSGYGPSGCWDQVSNDVWFQFVARATGVNIVINGRNIGSTLRSPQASL